ncbi:septal ring lytic transglycosylase RlpA family protein [Oryzifoliimicrobium ureilyticus]|uniref:septal ring lytic transglycosylase RlpA family protein n=1 Tax=Oryzifoliimicrobium ureilyticus TaxID=3113724 RepID=UPI0030760072
MRVEYGAASFATGIRWLALSVMCVTLAACGTTKVVETRPKHGKEYFSEKEYGVKASPRVANGNNIPKGGGRYLVGNPYQVRGKWYYPKEDFSYNKTGIASWYGSAFHGRLTANGEVYDQLHLSAAHPTLPLPSYARVTNLENGSSVIVRVNDRGPYHEGRIIDLSNKTADLLDMQHSGTGRVRVQYVGRAQMDGHDMPFLMASYVPKGSRVPGVVPDGQIATGVMVASNSKRITGDELQSLESYTPRQRMVPGPVSTVSYVSPSPRPQYKQQPAPALPPVEPRPVTARAAPSAGEMNLPNLGPQLAGRPSGKVVAAKPAATVKGSNRRLPLPEGDAYVETAESAHSLGTLVVSQPARGR